jgi:hypothetical protein
VFAFKSVAEQMPSIFNREWTRIEPRMEPRMDTNGREYKTLTVDLLRLKNLRDGHLWVCHV